MRYREGLVLLRSVIEELQAGLKPTFPTVLFEKGLVLNMGDMTAELYAVGGTHTTSDIMIFVPYLKTLWEGLRELKAQGATLEEAKARYTIERDFPYFKDRMLKVRDVDIHENNVEAIWARIGGQRTPSGRLQQGLGSPAGRRTR